MKIALQIGITWLLGMVVFFVGGTLFVLAVGVHPVLAGLVVAAVVVLFVCLGLAVYEADRQLRVVWGVTVSVAGIVGTVFVYCLAEDLKLHTAVQWLLLGLPYSVVAALFARNWWVRGVSAFVLGTVLLLAPASTWGMFFRAWESLG